MTSDEQTPKIQVDTDWKAEAQAEKERLARQEAEREEQGGNEAPGELPPADFKGLIGLLASQAIMGLGAYTDPKSGGVVIDLVGSKFAIDLLAVIEEKTKGNLDEAETTELGQILTELRSRFVQVADAVAKQQANTAAAGPLDPTKGTGKGVIETP
ncbi:MAG: DUF1844 domain-containing protein [Planctomycetota bacterium]|nr:DUF1844 domain-containing protein [Planctomycetota bacterium]MEC9156868.1 DUF1844 domain-containing protein [Planctomycetota bacterium]MEC9232355.1 DUF1844 domain-containing protein [Planctomycetota bacterium]MED5508513.1 DUF1844 domain-containing protein [Planctomycetota bacterium]